MAPKRPSSVVRTTRIVVEETVKIEGIGSELLTQEVGAMSMSTTTPVSKEVVIKEKHTTIPVESQEEEEEEGEQETVKEKKGGVRRQGNKKGRRRRRRSGGFEGYKIYLHRLMKEIHPDMEISEKAMTVVNNFVCDMFERLMDEAALMSKYANKMTLTSREIQMAVRLVLPRELGKHAVAEGTRAVINYVSYPKV